MIQITPTIISSHPAYKSTKLPIPQARIRLIRIPVFIALGVIHPSAVARLGPSRSSRSLPFRKSNKSLIKLEAICMRKANRKQITVGCHCNLRFGVIIISPVPMSTGAAAAGKVLGRIARSQASVEFTGIVLLIILINQ